MEESQKVSDPVGKEVPEGATKNHLQNSEIAKIALIQVLCMVTIILALYAFSNRTILVIADRIETQEYTKVGGEENYRLLQEIQKDQVNSMIQEYSITNPGYIEQIKKKIRSGTGETLSDAPQKKRLTTDEMVSLKSKTPTFGNTGATITLIEFSDFTCKYCHDFHNQQVLSQLEQTYSGVINRIYKNIPGRKNLEGLSLSALGKCSYSLSGSLAYSKFIDKAFSIDTQASPIWSSTGAIDFVTKDLGIDTTALLTCQSDETTKFDLDREFGQSIYLGIKVAPSTLVLSNETGEYRIVEGVVTVDALQKVITEFATP